MMMIMMIIGWWWRWYVWGWYGEERMGVPPFPACRLFIAGRLHCLLCVGALACLHSAYCPLCVSVCVCTFLRLPGVCLCVLVCALLCACAIACCVSVCLCVHIAHCLQCALSMRAHACTCVHLLNLQCAKSAYCVQYALWFGLLAHVCAACTCSYTVHLSPTKIKITYTHTLNDFLNVQCVLLFLWLEFTFAMWYKTFWMFTFSIVHIMHNAYCVLFTH